MFLWWTEKRLGRVFKDYYGALDSATRAVNGLYEMKFDSDSDFSFKLVEPLPEESKES
jgi:hypothetical protein